MDYLNFKKKPLEASLCYLAIFFLFSHFFIRPILYRNDAVRTLKFYLKGVEHDSPPEPSLFWENKERSPALFSVSSHKIISKEFYKNDGVKMATFHVLIDFDANDMWPSGKEWIFELVYTKVGWKIRSAAMLP